MAVNDFPHSIPNNSGSKIRKEEPDLSYSVPDECGISTHNGTLYVKTCEYPGSVSVDENITSVGGNITATSGTVSGVTLTATGGVVNGTATGNKTLAAFDIPHVKRDGVRIRHIVAEGPEPGIYIRGKLSDKNIIDLPEYWDGLVDPDSITVTLTQISYSQDLIVDEIDIGKKTIIIKSGTGADINCFYEVWAARWVNPMDHSEKLHVTYDGETPNDYPGNKENFLVGGWDYDKRNPKWNKK